MIAGGIALAAPASAQDTTAAVPTAPPPRATARDTRVAIPLHATPHGDWRKLVAGMATSLLLHEGGHVLTAYAVGARPTLGFDRGRPTVFSGIDPRRDPHDQFLFSSAGLVVQTLLDEAILDVPHQRGGAFERGILAGGIGTAWFYATVGRNTRVSDITWIARTSSMSRARAAALYAGLATIQALRIARDGHYANFFLRPSRSVAGRTGITVGVAIRPLPEPGPATP